MIKINLIASPQKKKRKKIKSAPGSSNFSLLLIIINVLSLLIAGGVTGYLMYDLSDLEKKLTDLNSQKSQLTSAIARIKNAEKMRMELVEQSSIIVNLRKNQSIPVKIIDEISNLLPEGVWLDKLTYGAGSVKIEGFAFTNPDIVNYVNNLKNAAHLIFDVYLEESKETQLDGNNVYKFALKFRVKG